MDVEAAAARAPEAFRANYREVARFLRDNAPLAKTSVDSYTTIGRAPQSLAAPTDTDLVDVAYSTYLFVNDALVRLDMVREPTHASAKEAPGVFKLTITRDSRAQPQHIGEDWLRVVERALREDRLATIVRADFRPHLTRRHTLGEFLEFLVSDSGEYPLLQYVFTRETHDAYWHYFVLTRLALVEFVPGGSGLNFLRQLDDWNVKRSIFTSPRLRIDAEVQAKEGRFEHNTIP